MNNLHQAALNRFAALPFPNNRDEHWRFANFKFWSEEIKKFLELPSEKSCAFAEIDDEFSKRFYGSLLAGGKFDALAAAAFCSRKLVRVEAGKTLKIENDFSALANVFIVEEGAELEVLRARNFEPNKFWIEANCFVLAKNAKVKINTFFTSQENSPRYSRNDFYLGEGANLKDVFVENGKTNTRAERNFYLQGANANVDAFALLAAEGGITHDFRSSQIHSSEKAKSNMRLKNILSDNSKSAFTGLVRVLKDAQKTEAYQNCRSLLLSQNAKASASPILEIMANDLICSHGCAVARPDKEQIFYMQARGISERDANKLLVSGFANEILDAYSDEIFAARVRAALG